MSRVRLAGVSLIGASIVAAAGCTDGRQDQPAASPPPTSTPPATSLRVQPSVFQVSYRLDGTVEASTTVGVDVPAGTVFAPAAGATGRVKVGDPIGALRLTDRTRGSGTVAESRHRLAAARAGAVTAPAEGAASLSPTRVAIGANGLDVVVPLKPLQELRYGALRFTGVATTETVLGQRRSPCVAIWLTDLPATTEGPSGASSAVHCRLGADVETAAGLPAVLSLTSPRQDAVVAVPLIYIGLDKTGSNYIARVREGAAGAAADRPVVVGSTDGVRRVISAGLDAGDVIEPVATP